MSHTPIYVPPPEYPLRNNLLGLAAFVALLMASFAVGSLLHGTDPSELKAATTKNAPASAESIRAPRANVTLVPVTGNEPPAIEEPITTAPAPTPQSGTNPSSERSDATALPSAEYAAAAARAQAERRRASALNPVDPRSITGRVESDSQPRPAHRTLPSADAVPHTEPVPEYQPVPDLHADRPATARLVLTVGPDGRVRDIDTVQPLPDETPRLIAAVQSWRFRPAMQSGLPVTARFTVDITVRPR